MADRITLSRATGWRMLENTVKVDRTTRWGNPFDLRPSVHCWTAVAYGFRGDPAGRQAASVALFRAWIKAGKPASTGSCGLSAVVDGEEQSMSFAPAIEAPAPPTVEEIRAHLRGKNLACWCPPGCPCHADVLLEIANS